MSDYSRREAIMQASGKKMYVDEDTGAVLEALQDDRYDWRHQKCKTLEVADLYREAGDDEYAARAASCSTWLRYYADHDGDRRSLQAYNACHLRMCPLCARRRANIMTARLVRTLTALKQEHPEVRLLFLTLTLRNCSGGDLGDTITQLLRGWSKLMRRRPVDRAVRGWFRALEITRNPKDGTYHPHVHAILAVEPEYFARSSGLYLEHSRWMTMWADCLQVDYLPSVRISCTYDRRGGDTDTASLSAALEAAKYATKDVEYIGQAPAAERADVLRTYTDALAGRRLVAMGGWIRTAAHGQELDDEGDLVHDGDDVSGDDLTSATAEMIEVYGWHWTVRDHVLLSRRRNPDFAPPVPPPEPGVEPEAEGGDNDDGRTG